MFLLLFVCLRNTFFFIIESSQESCNQIKTELLELIN